MRQPFSLILFILGLTLAASPVPSAWAHGVIVNYTTGMAVQIQARYDNNDPMAEAQVTVYAPGDLTQPWLQGTTDAQGNFMFLPDRTKPGLWDVQVRQAGHGEIIRVPVGEELATAPTSSTLAGGSNGYTLPQILLMSAAGIWGFVGTALYFARRKA